MTTDRNHWAACSPAWLAAMPEGACSWAPRRAGDGRTVSHYHPAVPVPSPAGTDHRAQLLDALDFAYCQGLGYDSPEALLAAYDAACGVSVPPPADQTALRELAAEAVRRQAETGNVRYDAIADAVLAVLSEQTDRAAAGLPAIRPQTLTALASHIDARSVAILRPDSQTYAEWQAMAALLRRVAAEEQPAETGRRETAEYFVQCQQPDGTWEQASSTTTSPEFAAQRLAARRKMQPDLVLRIAERTTKVNVRALPDCLACRHWSCTGNGPCGALLDAWQRCTCTRPAVGEQPETRVATLHAIPLPGSNGISACCGRPPCEFVGERVTRNPDEVTCRGPE